MSILSILLILSKKPSNASVLISVSSVLKNRAMPQRLGGTPSPYLTLELFPSFRYSVIPSFSNGRDAVATNIPSFPLRRFVKDSFKY